MQTLKGLDPIMPLICQKSSKRTLTGGVRSGGASTRSPRSGASARAILALGALGSEIKSRVRGHTHRNMDVTDQCAAGDRARIILRHGA